MPEKKSPNVKEYEEKYVLIHAAECTRDTDNAILVSLVDGSEHWFPKRQIHDDSEVFKRGDTGKLIVTKWVAIKRELWEEE